MKKIENCIIGMAGVTVLAINVLPLSANAATDAVAYLRTFSSSYSRTDNEMRGKIASVEMEYNCQLSGTNYVYSKLTTINNDEKEVYAAEWNKNGTAKSKTTIGSTAGVSASYNAAFFTPVRTFHSFYSTLGDALIGVWYN